MIFFLTSNKNGYVCDELLSFSDIASIYTDAPRFYQSNELFNQPHTKQEWQDSLTVDKADSVFSQSFEKIWSSAMGDGKQFNCNLYMFLMNFVCSFFPGILSKWIPIIINFMFFQASQFIMLRISRHFFINKTYRICLMLAFGFSAGVLACIIYIRFYMLATFMVLLLLWLLFRLADEPRLSICILYMPIMLLICYLGYRVHQYFAIYGTIVIACFGVYLILTKQIKKIFLYVFSFSGAFVLLILSPFRGWLVYMITKGEGANQIGRLFELNGEAFRNNLTIYWGYFYRHIIGSRFNLIICVLVTIFFLYMVFADKAIRKNKKGLFLIMLLLSVIIYTLFLIKVSAESEWRYLSIIYAPAIMCITTLFYVTTRKCRRQSIKNILFLTGILILFHMLGNDLQKGSVDYIYFDAAEKKEIIAANYSDLDNIYICREHLWNILLEYDIMSENTKTIFVQPSNVYVAEPFSDTYDKESCLLWFMTRGENYSEEMEIQIIQEIKEKTHYKTIDYAFSTEYSNVYVMKK